MNRRKLKEFVELEASEGYSSQESDSEPNKHEISHQAAQKLYTQQLLQREKRRKELSERLSQLLEINQDNQDQGGGEENCDALAKDSTEHQAPTLSDPKVFKISCRKGGELELFGQILNIVRAQPKIKIAGFFHNPRCRGSVYVEAFFEQHIQEILRELTIPGKRSLTYIEPHECKSLLEVDQDLSGFYPGQWVRLRKHRVYAKDLARIVRINQFQNRLTLKLINRDPKTGQKVPISCQLDRTCIGIEEGFNVNDQRSKYIYDSADVELQIARIDGFQLIQVSPDQVERNIKIHEEELKMFFPDVTDRKVLVQQAKKELMRSIDFHFQAGQRVRLSEGMQGGPEFTIEEVFPDENMLKLKYEKNNQVYTYLVHAEEVRIAFQKFQTVKVIGGPHKGDTGVIISLKKDCLVIDTECDTYSIHQSLVAVGREVLNHAQHQLVRYGANDLEVGCVIKQSTDMVQILNLANNLVNVALSKIQSVSGSIATLNEYGEGFRVNDNVQILSGRHQNKFGLVKQCMDGKLYLYNHLFTPNPIILEDANNCRLIFSNKQQVATGNSSRQWLGKVGVVIAGQWAGYKGLVVKVLPNGLLVQLLCNNIKVRVQLSEFEY